MKLGNATIVLSCDNYDIGEDEENVGGGNAEVSTRDYLRLYRRNRFNTYAIEIEEVEIAHKADRNGTIILSNDDLIVFLNAAMTEPKRKYNIHFSGLAYWFWHDIIHTMRDVSGGSINVNADSENRALYEGAKLAHAKGVAIEQIVRELVKAETAYRERFNKSTDALERFLSDVEVSI